MSYANNIAQMDLDEIIARAVREDDSETLYKWANAVAKTDEELGTQILQLARKADDNEWAYDREKDNQ